LSIISITTRPHAWERIAYVIKTGLFNGLQDVVGH
jgi:hypothetical protein